MLSIKTHDKSENMAQKPLAIDDSVKIPPSLESETMGKAEQSMQEKPISRAERRKRIKEEIMAGSEEAGFKGYRRRMW